MATQIPQGSPDVEGSRAERPRFQRGASDRPLETPYAGRASVSQLSASPRRGTRVPPSHASLPGPGPGREVRSARTGQSGFPRDHKVRLLSSSRNCGCDPSTATVRGQSPAGLEEAAAGPANSLSAQKESQQGTFLAPGNGGGGGNTVGGTRLQEGGALESQLGPAPLCPGEHTPALRGAALPGRWREGPPPQQLFGK